MKPSRNLSFLAVPDSFHRNFKVQLFELEIQLKNQPKNSSSLKTIWRLCYKLSSLCLQQSLSLYKSNEISKAEVYIIRALSFTDYDNNARNWIMQLDFQKLRLEIAHVFAMIFKHKKENFIAYQTLQNISSTIELSLFRNNLEKSLVGVDVLYKNLAFFAYKLDNNEEVMKIAKLFIHELKELFSNRKELEKLKQKTQINCPQLYDDFISQKKGLLSCFYYLLAKCQEKIKEDEAAMENIKAALEVINDKSHEFYKKYNKFYQELLSRAALKHSIEINYEEFKRNLLEQQKNDETNKKNDENNYELSFTGGEKQTILPSNLKNVRFSKKPPSKSLHKMLVVSETFVKNRDFYEKQKLFNQSLNNCSTTIRNTSSLRSKASSFHNKLDSFKIPSQKISVKFPFDMKSLLNERPKSAAPRTNERNNPLILNKKLKSKEKSFDRERFHEKLSDKSEKTKEKEPNEKNASFLNDGSFRMKEKTLKGIIKDLIKPSNLELSDPKTPVPLTFFEKTKQRILTKAFSTKFNILSGQKPPSKSSLASNDRVKSRRFSERPEQLMMSKILKAQQPSQHIRYSSAAMSATLSSAGKSPLITSPGKKLSYNMSDSESSEDKKSATLYEEKKEKSNKSIKPPWKLATISPSSEETPPLTPKNVVEKIEKIEEVVVLIEKEEKLQKFECKVPFVKVIFSWLLLKKKKQNLQKAIFNQLENLSVAEFFGTEFEAIREKLLSMMSGHHRPFWFFCKPPGNCLIYYWLVSKITLDLRKGDDYSENELQDISWNVKGIEIRLRVFLENSRSRGPFFTLEISEKLEGLMEELKEIDEFRNECFYKLVNLVLTRFLEKWDSREKNEMESNLKKSNVLGDLHADFDREADFKPEIFQKYQRRKTSILDNKGNISEFKGTNEESFIENMQDQISFILSNLVKMKRKPNGFSWTLRSNPSMVQEEKNLETLIEKTKAYSRKEIIRLATFRKPLGVFKPKEKRATGYINIFNKNKDSMEVSQDYFRRNSLLKVLQRNSQNSLLMANSQYKITEPKFLETKKIKESDFNSSEKKNNLEPKEKEISDFSLNLPQKTKLLDIENVMEINSPPRYLLETRNKDFSQLLKKITENEEEKTDKENIGNDEMTKESLPIPREMFSNGKEIMLRICAQENLMNESIPRIFTFQNTLSEISVIGENFNENDAIIENLIEDKNFTEDKKSSNEINDQFINEQKNDIPRKNPNPEKTNDIFPEKPYDAEEDSLRFFLNSFNDKDILLQGIYKKNGWKLFVLSLGFINQSQRFCRFLKSEENTLLSRKMKEYFFNLNVFNLSNTRKIIDFSSIPFDQFVNNFLSLSSNQDKLLFFKKFNLLNGFPLSIQKNILSSLQNSHISTPHIIMKKKLIIPSVINEYKYNSFSSIPLYYFKGRHLALKKNYRLQTYDSYLILSCYEPFTQKADYCLINDDFKVEKIRNLMKIRNPPFKWKVMLSNISFHRTLIGKKLYFNRKDLENMSYGNMTIYKAADLLAAVQHPFLRNHYRNEIFYELFQIKCIGKCYIKIRIFYPLSEEIPKDFIKLKFEFLPVKLRRKVFKFVCSHGDFFKYFKKELPFSNIRALLTDFNTTLFSRIILHKENLQYLALRTEENLPLNIIRMDFNKKASKEAHSMLRIDTLKYRTIFQLIKRIKGSFALITIKQHLHLNQWSILLYFPHNNRTFSITIYPYELMSLSKEFWRLFIYQRKTSIRKSTFSDPMQKKSLELNSMPHIDDLLCLFHKNYKDLREALILACKGKKAGNLIGHIARKTGFLFNWDKKTIQSLKNNNLELLFWEEFMKISKVEIHNDKKLVLNVDRYKAVIREILMEKLAYPYIFYQIHFEEQIFRADFNIEKKKLKSMAFLNFFERNVYEKPKNLRFYVRAIDIRSNERKNYRFEGRDLRDGFNEIMREFGSNPEDFLNKMKKFEKPQINRKGLEGWQKGRIIFLYKGPLISSKRYMITLVYMMNKREVEIRIYNQMNGEEIVTKVKIQTIMEIFPYLKILLWKGEYKIIGERMMKLLRNTLILQIFKTNLII